MKIQNIVVAKDKHKYTVTLIDKNNIYKISFGAKGYSDFITNKDVKRKERYILRHQAKEDWSKSGILTAGFWSRWVLWNLPSLKSSIENTQLRFNL